MLTTYLSCLRIPEYNDSIHEMYLYKELFTFNDLFFIAQKALKATLSLSLSHSSNLNIEVILI